MVVAVTGIDGFIGKKLQLVLLAAGYNIIPIGKKYGHDITDKESLSGIPSFDIMIHLAAVSFVPDSYKNPELFYRTNVGGTGLVLELVRKFNARMVYISSYIYGIPVYQPIDEAHPVQPFNPYAQSKWMAEELCTAYNRDFKIPVTILRPFNIYSEGQAEHFLLPDMIRQVKTSAIVTVNDTRPRRDYVHTDDVAAAISKAVLLNNQDTVTINIGSGKSSSPADICSLLEDITGQSVQLVSRNQSRENEIMDTVCNNSLAKKILNWSPQITLQEGLKKMYELA